MQQGVHGLKHKTSTLITRVGGEFLLHTARMASASSTWEFGSNTSSVVGNTPAVTVAQKKKGSFGGPSTSKSCWANTNGAHSFQFGSVTPAATAGGGSETTSFPESLDPVEGPNVVQQETVVNNEIEQVDKVDHSTGQPLEISPPGEVQGAAVKNVVQENSVPQPPKASSAPAWGQVGTAKDLERKKSSAASPNPSFTSPMNDEHFPALGAPSSGKATIPKRQPWKPVAVGTPKPEAVTSVNSKVDSSVVEVPPKPGGRREADTSGAEGWGHKRHEQYKFTRGRGGRDNYRGGDPINALGILMTRILRHQAVDLNIKLRSDGYAVVKELLNLHMKTISGRPLTSHTVEDVLQAVERDNKQRFGIKEENGVLLIRANQGHTIKTVESEELLKSVLMAEEIPVCVHGTYRKSWPSIAKEGLKRMSRNHVHFASGLSPADGVRSGMRKTSEILIYLDVSKALEDGMKLFISENGVILTDGFDGIVPPKYFKDVRSWPDNKQMKIL